MWPQGGAIFGPRGIIWTNLVEVHKVKLRTKYQGSRPYENRQKHLSIYIYIYISIYTD